MSNAGNEDVNFVKKTGDELLIEMVKSYPASYCKTHPEFKNNLLKKMF